MTPDDDSQSILPAREDIAVAFCTRCGQVCDGQVPSPGGKWRCSGCRRSCKLLPADTSVRLRHLLRLLRSKNKNVVAMAQHGLISYGETSTEWLLSELAERPKIAECIAPVLGRVGGQRAVEALLKEMRSRRGKQLRAKWIWRWIFLAAAVYAFAHSNTCFGLFLLLFVSVPSFLPQDKAAVQALEALRDPLAVGPIAAAHRRADLRRATVPALRTLLPLLRDEHAGHIKPGELQAINDLTGSRDADLALKAVAALGFVGDARSLEVLQALASERQGGTLAEAARTAVPALQRRLTWREEKRTLLRAAGAAPDVDSATLLRPASSGETESKQLLRPAEGPGEE